MKHATRLIYIVVVVIVNKFKVVEILVIKLKCVVLKYSIKLI